MIQSARTWRVIAGGLAAGAIAVMTFAGATASADPLLAPTAPTPAVPAVPTVPVVPVVPAPGVPVLNGATAPGANTNRFVTTPQGSYPAGAPAPAATPGAPGAPGTGAVSPTPPSATPVATGTLRDYLQAKGVKLEAQRPQGFKALEITLPMPTRWTQVPDPNVPDAFLVIADRLGTSLYTSNAQVVVYKLVGNFDPREAITHGFVDTQQLLAWQTTNASQADFLGFPSSIIEGTYRQNDMTLNTSRRHIIATSGADKYLVSLSVTTGLSSAVADGPATDAIINGFRVAGPGAPAPVPAQAPTVTPPTATPGATPTTGATPATGATPTTGATPATGAAPVGLPAQVPATAPVGLPTQVPATPPVGLPGQVPASSQTPGQQSLPNLLALVPGLPPLPNLNLNLTGAPQR